MDLTPVDRIASAVGRQATRRLVVTALARVSAGTALATLVAVPRGEDAEAKKRRKPPLAFLAIVVTSVNAPDEFGLNWFVSESLTHPEAGFTKNATPSVGTPANLPPDKMRAEIVAQRRGIAVTTLQNAGHPVPEDRIAVTLL